MRYDSAFSGDPETYDRTRGFPPGVVAQVVAPLRAALSPGAAVLDLGAGTGRLAVPLAAAGYAVWAVDLAPAMLARLGAKAAAQGVTVRRVLADAHALPCAAGAFAAVVTVHVLHLLADWRRALAEVARVLAPGGRLWLGYLHHDPTGVVGWTLRAWRAALACRGYDLDHPGWRNYADLVAAVGQTWRAVAVHETPPWTVTLTPAQALDGVARRLFSPYQGLPEAEHAALLQDLTRVARQVFADLDRPRPDRRAFRWHVFAPPR